MNSVIVQKIYNDSNGKHIGALVYMKSAGRSGKVGIDQLKVYKSFGMQIKGATVCKDGTIRVPKTTPIEVIEGETAATGEEKARNYASQLMGAKVSDKLWHYIKKRLKREYNNTSVESISAVVESISRGSKIYVLASYLKVPIYKIEYDKNIELYTVVINGEERQYAVFTDEEADNNFYAYEQELIEDIGINAFSESFKNWVFEYGIKKDKLANIVLGYYDDSEYELNQQQMRNIQRNPEKYLVDNYGKSELVQILAEDSSLLDINKICRELKKLDGRGGVLGGYDGDEIEVDNYFIYRVN